MASLAPNEPADSDSDTSSDLSFSSWESGAPFAPDEPDEAAADPVVDELFAAEPPASEADLLKNFEEFLQATARRSRCIENT